MKRRIYTGLREKDSFVPLLTILLGIVVITKRNILQVDEQLSEVSLDVLQDQIE